MSCRTTCCRWRPSISLCGGTCNPGERSYTLLRCVVTRHHRVGVRATAAPQPPSRHCRRLRCVHEKLRQRHSPPKKPFRLHRTSRVLPPPCQPERGGSPHGPWRPSSSRQRLLLSLAETAAVEKGAWATGHERRRSVKGDRGTLRGFGGLRGSFEGTSRRKALGL